MTAPSDRGPSDPGAPRGPLLRLLRAVGRHLAAWPRVAGVGLTGAWALLIWASSAQPGGRVPTFPGSAFCANLMHAPLFGLLAFWAVLCLPRRRGWPHLDVGRTALVVVTILAYGLVDEWHQASIPGRQPSAWDLGTDVVGAVATLVVIRFVGRDEADERGLRLRLAGGVVACAVAAAASTWAPAG